MTATVAVLGFVLASVTGVSAAEWTSNAGGSWGNAANWDALPTSADDTVIDNNNDAGMPSGSTVTLDGDRHVQTLTLDLTITIPTQGIRIHSRLHPEARPAAFSRRAARRWTFQKQLRICTLRA